MMDVETWMNAKEALSKGFIDAISGEDDTLPEVSDSVLNSYKDKTIWNRISSEPGEKHPPQNNQSNFMKALITQTLGLNPSASDETIIQAVNQLKKERDEAVQKLGDVTKKAKADAAEVLIDAAIEQKKITADVRKEWIDDAIENHELVKRTLAAIPVPVQISRQIVDNSADGSQDRKDWNFTTWNEKDPYALMQMRDDDPGKYAELYKKEFGMEPQMN